MSIKIVSYFYSIKKKHRFSNGTMLWRFKRKRCKVLTSTWEMLGKPRLLFACFTAQFIESLVN